METPGADSTAGKHSGLSVNVIALLLYILMAFFLFGPALVSGGSRVCSADTPDTWIHMWVFWRTKATLLGDSGGYYISNLISFPFLLPELIAVFDPLLPFFSFLLQLPGFNVPMVFNILTLTGVVFSAVAGHLLVSQVTHRRSLGFIGGVIIAFNPFLYRLLVGGYIEYAWWGFVPLSLWLYLRAMAAEKSLVPSFLYAAGVVMTFLMSVYCAFCLVFMLFFLTLPEVARWISEGPKRIIKAVRIHAIAVLCILPMLVFWGYNISRLDYRDLKPEKFMENQVRINVEAKDGAPEDTRQSPFDHITFSVQRTLSGSLDILEMCDFSQNWARQEDRAIAESHVRPPAFEHAYGREWIFLVILAVVAIAGCVPRLPNILWALAGLFFLLLALGPFPVFQGSVACRLPLPYGFLCEWVPGFSRIAIPGRFFLGAVLCLAVPAVVGASLLNSRRGPLTQAGTTAVDFISAIIVFVLFVSLGYGDAGRRNTCVNVPVPYERIAGDKHGGALLELPLRGNVAHRMFCQSVHGRPIFKGLIPSMLVDQRPLQGMMDNSLVRMIERSGPVREDLTGMKEEADRLAGKGFGYLLVHSDGYTDVEDYRNITSSLRACLGDPDWIDESVAVWRLPEAGEAANTMMRVNDGGNGN